jgi:hypothetical protein
MAQEASPSHHDETKRQGDTYVGYGSSIDVVYDDRARASKDKPKCADELSQ